MDPISAGMKLLTRIRNKEVSFGSHVRLEPSLIARGGVVEIGAYSVIRLGTILMPAQGKIMIGSETTINHYCVFHGKNNLSIGDGCLIAPRVSIFAANHAFHDLKTPIRKQGMTSKGGIKIGNNVWIGTGAIILDGVTIEDGAVIAAGSVITKSVAKNTIVAGNPAHVIGSRGDTKN